ncbi:MAG: hypothetical protein L0Y54_12650, partial [Sporichthyaceae bacterium]|nr:hypothetical protein [Sporichthyaceae bacterium]
MAVDQARASGAPVQIDALADEHATLTAQPDGSVEGSISTVPVRFARDGDWVDVDPTLVPNPDGTFSTAATKTGLTLSGGGSAPLAAMDNHGARLGISWPTALSTPTVTGNTALYADVLPDVDLQITANEYGGLSEVLIVKTAQAAANPALSTLTLATTTSPGLRIDTDAGGNLSVTDAQGRLAYHAATPRMWDSSGADSAAPDAGDRVAVIDMRTDTAGQIRLTPDPELLTGRDTEYPVYIDPSVVPVDWVTAPTENRTGYTYVQQGYPTTSNYNDGSTGLGVGYQHWSGNFGLERTFYQFSIPTSWGTSKNMKEALLNVTSNYSADNSCSNTYNVTATSYGQISASTTWSNQPGGPYTGTDTKSVAGAKAPSCPERPVTFDLTDTVDDDTNGVVTFRLTTTETISGSNNAFRRFKNSATLSVKYNTV